MQTTELDLRVFFEKFGHVREAKVIRSSEGTSKGYGFITFDTEDEAKTVMQISAVRHFGTSRDTCVTNNDFQSKFENPRLVFMCSQLFAESRRGKARIQRTSIESWASYSPYDSWPAFHTG